MEIRGKKVILIPIKPREKDEFYKLATKSYGSNFWYDKNKKKTCTKEKFFQSWHEGFFDSKSPDKGQCFWITVDKKKIGTIIYNKIDLENKKVEFDIIIGKKGDLGRGYGSDSLKTLIRYVFDNFNVNKIWIEARVNNPRAIRAYELVGFKKEGLLREENYFNGKFVDCIRFGILRKEFKINT